MRHLLVIAQTRQSTRWHRLLLRTLERRQLLRSRRGLLLDSRHPGRGTRLNQLDSFLLIFLRPWSRGLLLHLCEFVNNHSLAGLLNSLNLHTRSCSLPSLLISSRHRDLFLDSQCSGGVVLNVFEDRKDSRSEHNAHECNQREEFLHLLVALSVLDFLGTDFGNIRRPKLILVLLQNLHSFRCLDCLQICFVDWGFLRGLMDMLGPSGLHSLQICSRCFGNTA